VAAGTTIFATIQGELSKPELAAEVALATLYFSPIRQLAVQETISGTYQQQITRIKQFPSATTGTETSVPVGFRIEPGHVTVDPVVYEAATEVTKLAKLTSKYEIISVLTKLLGNAMAKKYTREFLQSIRGHAMTGLNLDTGASATPNAAVTYTPQAAHGYANFLETGATATTARGNAMLDLECIITEARAKYQMAPWSHIKGGGTVQTQKLAFLTSSYQATALQTGVALTVPFYRQFSGADKYYDFHIGEVPGMDVFEIWHTEQILAGVVTGEAGGIKFDRTNGYYEGFILADNAVKELTWEPEKIFYYPYDEEAQKRERFTVTAYKNFVLQHGQTVAPGLVSAIHIPVK